MTVAPIKSLEPTGTRVKKIWIFHLRPDNDDEPQDWWFVSTAVPLLAATFGPLANVMSIAALVTSWRNTYDVDNPDIDALSIGIPDPEWCVPLNAASLVCGFLGNIFLLLNFTKRVRYIVALPATIILWYLATGIRPEQTYSQGFWHAVIAAVLYLLLSMVLMVNMLGYFLGHYPQHFELSDDQRNLILQTMMFFIWLAGGAGVFARLEPDMHYVDALYFCDVSKNHTSHGRHLSDAFGTQVTILTVGFGEFHPTNDVSRGVVFPYSVGGIIILGLMVSSIRTFAQEISHDNIVKKHAQKRRVQTLDQSVTSAFELEQGRRHSKAVSHRQMRASSKNPERPYPAESPRNNQLKSGLKMVRRVGSRKQKLLLLQEEKDRFDAMRSIQKSTLTFKKYSALSMSVIASDSISLGIDIIERVSLCLKRPLRSPVVVERASKAYIEYRSQGLTYFQALYFCYISLLTIGYGDISPSSNGGKPFFIVWSLVAVPTMTILISDMGDTVIGSFKRGTFTLADWTVLPKAGVWRSFLERHPQLWNWLVQKAEEAEEEKRVAQGFPAGPAEKDLEEIAELHALDEHALAQKLGPAIRETANDLRADPPRQYSYEEWVKFTRLIRFSRLSEAELDEEEQEQGLVEWDWIGENSPMMAEQSESEWLLDRLCESLDRYLWRQDRRHYTKRRSPSRRKMQSSSAKEETQAPCSG
ncbi:MAG: hypothetical protein Q9172_005473 [Xanthocarpia lactea]